MVYRPRVLKIKTVDKIANKRGPKILISPNGNVYPATYFSSVSKKLAKSKLILKITNNISKTRIIKSKIELNLVEAPS